MISFSKMHGTGNDFVVLDNRTAQFSEADLEVCARKWCPRRYGIGADGLLALDDPRGAEADYRMHYVNADGSRATMCGNGARCLFRFARRVGIEGTTLTFETDAGLYRATTPTEAPERVRLFVPAVTDHQARVSLARSVPDPVRRLHYAHAGTQHLVALVEDVDAVPVSDWGERLRGDPNLAPEGANVNFVEIDGDATLRLRTYEKGVEAETPSCGTGVIAAAAVAEHLRQDAPPGAIHVTTRGGDLRVGRTDGADDKNLYLEGPAVTVYDGEISPPAPVRQADHDRHRS